MDINNKIAIVTGGCSGLGYATTRALLDAGVKVVIFDFNEEAGNKLVAELDDASAVYLSVDVRDEESIQSAVNSL